MSSWSCERPKNIHYQTLLLWNAGVISDIPHLLLEIFPRKVRKERTVRGPSFPDRTGSYDRQEKLDPLFALATEFPKRHSQFQYLAKRNPDHIGHGGDMVGQKDLPDVPDRRAYGRLCGKKNHADFPFFLREEDFHLERIRGLENGRLEIDAEKEIRFVEPEIQAFEHSD